MKGLIIRAVFAFVGADSVVDKLENYVKEYRMDNVIFIPYQDKSDLIYSLRVNFGSDFNRPYLTEKII